MHISVIFAILSYCVLYAKSAPLNGNDIPNVSMNSLFLKTKNRYDNYMKSPEPHYTLISSRTLEDIQGTNARAVLPQGVVVRKCPKNVGFPGKETRCAPVEFEKEEMVLEVYIGKQRVKKIVTVEHETKCQC